MKIFSYRYLLAGAIFLAAIPAFAGPTSISGSIIMAGTLVPTIADHDSLDLMDATGLDFGTGGSTTGSVFVTAANGDFSPFLHSVGSITNFDFNPFSAVPVFYSVTSGASTLSFDLTSVDVSKQTNTFLNIVGNGELSLTGDAPTAGIVNLTVTDSGSDPTVIFGFTAGSDNGSTVPEPASAAIFGLGLLALAGLYGRHRRTIG